MCKGLSQARGPMRVLCVLFQRGGLGDVGRFVVQHALARAEDEVRVRVLARQEDMALLTEDQVAGARVERVVVAFDEVDSLKEELRDADCVVSCAGNRQPGFPRRAHRATQRVVTALEPGTRLVMISSVGLGGTSFPGCVNVLWNCMLATVVRSAYKDLEAAEEVATSSALDFLIVRPVGIPDEELPKGTFGVGNPTGGIVMSKSDLGLFMLQEALNPTLHREAVVLGPG